MSFELTAAIDVARVRALEQHEAQLAAIVNSVRLAVISVDEAQTMREEEKTHIARELQDELGQAQGLGADPCQERRSERGGRGSQRQ